MYRSLLIVTTTLAMTVSAAAQDSSSLSGALGRFLDNLTTRGAGGRLTVYLLSYSPTGFHDGTATGCELKYKIDNATKYHLNDATVEFEKIDWHFNLPEMVANSTTKISRIDPAPDKPTLLMCSTAGRLIKENEADAWVSNCSMQGLAEGDCQHTVDIKVTFSADDIARVAAQEKQQLDAKQASDRAQMQRNRDALAGLGK